MATLRAQKITESGLSSSMVACTAAGDEFTNTGMEFIRIQNHHTSNAYTVRVNVVKTSIKHPTYGNLTKSDIYKSVSSPGGSAGDGANDIIIGPFKQGAYNNSNNKITLNYKVGSHTNATDFEAASNIATDGSQKLNLEILYLET